MTQEKIDKLPEHLKGIKFESYHFYYNKKAKVGENPLLLQDNFIDDVMRIKNIQFRPEITRVIHIEGDRFYVEAKVDVWNNIDYKTTAYASMTRMPHETGQTHYCQMCITRALKTAVLRHLNISDNDVRLAIEAYEINLKNVQKIGRNITKDEPDETDETKPEIIEPEIDLNLEI